MWKKRQVQSCQNTEQQKVEISSEKPGVSQHEIRCYYNINIVIMELN